MRLVQLCQSVAVIGNTIAEYYAKYVQHLKMRHNLYQVCTVSGLLGSAVVHLIGEYDVFLEGLITLMVLDYLGGFLVALFGKSKKTKNGGLSSRAGLIGLAKKCFMLFLVVAMNAVDRIIGGDYARNAIIVGLIANELISLTENACLMIGKDKVPPVVLKVIEVLKEKSDSKEVNG